MPPGHRRALGNAPCSSWALAQECTRLWLGHNPGVRDSSLRLHEQHQKPSGGCSAAEPRRAQRPNLLFHLLAPLLQVFTRGMCQGSSHVGKEAPLCHSQKAQGVGDWVNWEPQSDISSVPASPAASAPPLQQQGQLPASSAALPHHPFQHCASSAHGCRGLPSLPAPSGQSPILPKHLV